MTDDLNKKLKERTIELSNLLIEQKKIARMLIHRDLELTKANEKLQKLDKVKSDFISVVAHQLRTPLSGIKWTLSLLLSGDVGSLNKDQNNLLNKTYKSNDRMIALINDMLIADGIQSGRVHYGFNNLDIVSFINDIIFEVNPIALKRNILIKYKDKFENLPQAYIDKESMYAVVQNLLENAIKYSKDGGEINIDIKKDKDHFIISITDHGIGIPKDQQENIFSKFFRARNAVQHEIDGTGLGLFIAKETILKNNGLLWFESIEGEGSTFYFTVPLQKNS